MALAIILLAGFALRLALRLHGSGPLWFEEAVPVVWATRLWGFQHGHFDPNPHSALWPHLSAYCFFLVQVVQCGVGLASGQLRSLTDFRVAGFLDPGLLRGGAMFGAIAIGLAAIVATERLATRLAGPAIGVAVALLLAFEPLHVRYSLVPGPDMLVALFVALGLGSAVDVLRGGRARDSVLAGLWIGLGTAAKFSPALLLVPLALAHAWGPARSRLVRFVWCLVATIGAFTLASPFTWVDLASRRGELGGELAAFMGGPFGATSGHGALTYLSRVVPGDLGWPLTVLIGIAVTVSILRPSRERALLLAFAVPYAILLGVAASVFERYLVPLVPGVLVLAASAARDAPGRPVARRWALAAAVGLIGLGWNTARYAREALSPDSRLLTREWIIGHLPARSLIALESLGPELPDLDREMELAALPDLSQAMRQRLEHAPMFSIAGMPMTVHDPDAVWPFYDLRDLAGFDAVVVSGSVRDRYLAERSRFPVQADFYEGLDRFWKVRYRSPAGSATGPEIVVYGSDSTRIGLLESWWSARLPSHGTPARSPPDELLAFVFARRAMCLTRAGRDQAALREWPKALRWEHAPAEWWYAEGLAMDATRDRPNAIITLREAYRRDPTLVDAGLLAAELSFAEGAVDESRRLLQAVEARAGLNESERKRARSLGQMLTARGARGPQ